MASVFTPCAGGVHRVVVDCGGGGGAIFQITFDGVTLGLPVTGFALELQGNYQFLHTVNDFIYVYAFGDRIGELVITGMGFYGNECEAWTGSSICELLDYYKEHRISKWKPPILIKIGDCDEDFKGFLTGMRMEVTKPEVNIAQWVLRFNVLPPS